MSWPSTRGLHRDGVARRDGAERVEIDVDVALAHRLRDDGQGADAGSKPLPPRAFGAAAGVAHLVRGRGRARLPPPVPSACGDRR